MLKRLVLVTVLGAALAVGQTTAQALPDPTEDPLMITAGFLTGHPDLKYKLLGLEKYKSGDFDAALKFFRRAAFYADKPSQGMVGEMHWRGEGGGQDRALAYAWMDLAAERGYRGFLGVRERYWAELDPAERARAVESGQELYARYGDAAAKPRIAAVLRRARREVTGSRTGGGAGSLQIVVPGPSGAGTIDGSKFFDSRYWDPEQYAAWHDQIWMNPRTGRVRVGELEHVPGESRIPETAPEVDAPEPGTPDEPAP